MHVTVINNPVDADIIISFKQLDLLTKLWSKYSDLVKRSKLETIEFDLSNDIPTD